MSVVGVPERGLMGEGLCVDVGGRLCGGKARAGAWRTKGKEWLGGSAKGLPLASDVTEMPGLSLTELTRSGGNGTCITEIELKNKRGLKKYEYAL